MLASMGSSSLKAASFCNLDIQLRKCCNHLYLLKGVQDDIEKKCVTDEDYFNKLIEGSGKMILLDKFIDKYREDGHKILVFS
jgi:chromodomain-helicase-DNA-binding protein 7